MSKKETIDILAELRAHIARKYLTQTAAAAVWGYSRAFVSAVVKGNKPPTEKMLQDAGFRKVQAKTTYERV